MNDDHKHRNPGEPRSWNEERGRIRVEDLLRAAGPAPELPPSGADRVKDAIRPLWLEEVAAHRRSRRRVWLVAAAAVAATVLVALLAVRELPTGAQPGRAPFVIAAIRGSVELIPADGQPVRVDADDLGREVPAGARILSGGGRVALGSGQGASLRIDRATGVRLTTARLIELDRGAVYVDSGEPGDGGLEVGTALGTVHEMGTQFEVRSADSGMTVRVRDGLVAVSADRSEHNVAAGTALAVSADGRVTTVPVSRSDPSWSWVQAVAPDFAIEGRSVTSFLSWVSRETGLEVRFAEPEVERLASSTTLHGSIAGLEPVEALAAVLPGCRLTATEEAGVLLIESAD